MERRRPNWLQLARHPQWVVGVEADLQAANISDRVNCFLPCNVPIAITTGVASAFFPVTFSEVSAESKLDWFGTVRARLGRASGPALFYFTGGLAYGEVSSSARVTGTTNRVIVIGGGQVNTFAGSFDTSTTKVVGRPAPALRRSLPATGR